MKKPHIKILLIIALGALFATIWLFYTIDDPRVQVNAEYTVNGISETYFSGVDKHNNHIAVENKVFGIHDNVQIGDKYQVTILINDIVSIKEVR